MSSLIGKVEIPHNFSIIEEEAAKVLFLKERTNKSEEDKIAIAYYEDGVKLAYGFKSYFLAKLPFW